MSSPETDYSASRVVRGVLLGFSSAALAVSAHALGDGVLPDAAMTVLLTALIGWTATALAAKARGTLGILAVLGTGQLVMHLILGTLITHAGHVGVVNGWAMTATHAGATIVTAALLARAESMLRAAADVMRALLPTLWRAAPVPVAVATPTLIPSTETGHLVSVVLRRVHGRRGPPIYS